MKYFVFYIFSLTFDINRALLYSAVGKAKNYLYHLERRLVHNTVTLGNVLYIVEKKNP